MRVDNEYPERAAPVIIVHALSTNKRPVGFAPWPEEPKKKRKKTKKR